MLRVWGKLWAKGRMKESITVQDEHSQWSFEDRLAECEDQIVTILDLPRPIWLPKNRQELQEYGSTKFRQDNFIETFPFESLEIDIIERDEDEEER